ncbi:MAG: SurA N-terminal domain-containing protein [Flammeovirgaceae bacterium]|nr:SurA N-terminal domain-containing protein [Flammeovirgaceae bacterium]
MALIGTLRNRMGTWVVVFVFVAIASFVLSDLLGNNSVLFGNDNVVGEIGNHTVTLEEFQNAVKEREANYFLNTNREATENEMPGLRQQAWDLLIAKYAIQTEYSKVGIEVPTDEVTDMLWGKNVDAGVKQAFTNPETGAFEKDRVLAYMNQLKTMPETSEPRIRWELFQRDLRPSRERIKYENLLVKTAYVTAAEAERDYHLQNDVAEVKYLYVPYFAISDSAATVSDSDLKAYYNKNKERYKTEQSRDIKYVRFPVVASADDTASVQEEIRRLKVDLQAAQDDSTFAVINSDNAGAYEKYTSATLPAFVPKDSLFVGNVIGPIQMGPKFTIAKVSKMVKDTVFSAKASHILIKWDDDTDVAKKAAKEKARGILKEIKAGASFAAKASEHGTDGTASRGGDLGWFSTGQMVKPFEKAVFDATRTGILNDVVETEFGYHIIDVTNTKENNAYYISVIERTITAGDASINEALRKAESFAGSVTNEADFTENAGQEGLSLLEGKNIGTSDMRIGVLGDARQVVMWLFREAEKGKISEVFDLQDEYVVAVMTGEVEKGYKSLDAVKDEITPAVRNEVKGRMIIEKLSGQGSLEDLAKGFGNDASVYSSSDLKMNSNSIQGAGFDPQVVGLAFSLDNGKRSSPFAGENGVVVIEMQNKTIAPAVGDYAVYKAQLEQSARNRSFNIAEAIKDKAGIEDKRYKFY